MSEQTYAERLKSGLGAIAEAVKVQINIEEKGSTVPEAGNVSELEKQTETIPEETHIDVVVSEEVENTVNDDEEKNEC